MKHTFFAPDRETWRAWLERHHASADQVWLLFTRKRSSAVPPDLAAALDAEPKARTFFEELAPSYRRLYLAWVLDAKRPETRTRRVATVVSRSAQKLRPSLDM